MVGTPVLVPVPKIVMMFIGLFILNRFTHIKKEIQ
jgi:hypothetical protein